MGGAVWEGVLSRGMVLSITGNDITPLWTDTQVLPCPKLHLWVVITTLLYVSKCVPGPFKVAVW